jgi:hypothetical protein
MITQKSQPAETRHEYISSASTGRLKIKDMSLPARKARAHEIHEKAGSISGTCELPWPVRGDAGGSKLQRVRAGSSGGCIAVFVGL